MEYVPIRVSTLRGDQKIDFNVYIKLNDKNILYLRQGDSFEGERLKRLKDKKLKKMFIAQDDESKYRTYMQKNIEVAYDNKSSKDITTRAEIIQGAQQNNVEEVFENPEYIEAYNNAKDSAGKYVNFLMTNMNAISAIMKIENTEKSLSHHGVSVATLSVALCSRLGMSDPKSTQLLTLGALLHDFGHQDCSFNVAVPLSTLTKEQLTIYKKHPEIGAQKVQDKKHFDQTVINIISQHEEYIDGTGFPKGLRENQMDPLTIIVSTSNALDRLISFENIPKADAAKKLMLDHVGKHPLDHLKIMTEIIKTHL